jgi:virginiamycin B lyase
VAAVIATVFTAGCGAEEAPGGKGIATETHAAVGPPIPVGERGNAISGLAVGEGGVWAASGGGCSGSVTRIDPDRDEVVATIPVDDEAADVAVGGGAVWAVGGKCDASTPGDDARVFRIDPATNRLVATIPLNLYSSGRAPDFPGAVAAGQGGVWVALSFGPRTGEVVRIDPRTNRVVARIPTGGHVGELRLGGGSV